MSENSGIINAADTLKEAIVVVLDPLSSKEARDKALKLQFEFMEKSFVCGEVGMHFFNNDSNPAIRLVGLDIMSHYIKNRWDEMLPQQKELIKQKVVDLAEQVKMSEENYLKEGVAKVFVQVVKRTWPQEWPSLFSDLYQLQSNGDAQLELVLKIFNVFSEDVNGMDDRIKTQRRKDMLQTLNENIEDLFDFFLKTLQSKATELKTENTKENLEIAHAAITTITTYSSWVNFEHLLSGDLVLIKTLVLLLEVEQLKYATCDCLSTIFERKGQPEERAKMMVILSSDAMDIIFRVARATYAAARTDEEEYKTMKRLVEAMTHFGNVQIAVLWGDDKGFKEAPEGFLNYIKLLLDFTSLESMTIVTMALRTWATLLMNENISKSETVTAIIPTLLETLVTKSMRDTNPFVANAGEGSVFNSYDMNYQEEYIDQMATNRNAAVNLLDLLLKMNAQQVLDHALTQINNALNHPPPDVKEEKESVLLQSNHYRSWDALAFYCRHTINALLSSYPAKVTIEMAAACNEALSKLLNYKCDIATFRIPLLKTIESIFLVFKTHQEHLLPSVQMLFELITTPVELTETGRQHEFKLQRNACVAFTTICKSIPTVLTVIFDDLESYILGRLEEKHLTNNEKGVLLEGLLRISVLLENKEKKSAFLLKVLSFIENSFKKEPIQSAMKDAASLIKLIGIDGSERTEQVKDDLKQFLLALNCWHAMTKACIAIANLDQVEDDPDDNFLAQQANDFPWIQPMVNLLPNIFELAQQYCLIFTMREKIVPIINSRLELHQSDTRVKKREVPDAEQRKIINRGFHCLFAIHDIIYLSLGQCAHCLGPVLYSLPGLADVIVEKLVAYWKHLPINKCSKVWRTFMVPYTRGCPSRFRSLSLVPILAPAIHQTFERLCEEWKNVKAITVKQMINEYGEEQDQIKESEEVKYLRMLSKLSEEFIVAISQFCGYKRSREKTDASTAPLKEGQMIYIGELGDFLLKSEETNLLILSALFTSLMWPNAGLVNRVCPYINSLIYKMFPPEHKVNPELPNHLLMSLLQGLQQHGNDQTGQLNILNTTCKFYMHLRIKYPSIVQIMLMVSSCTEEALKEFDLEYLADIDEKEMSDAKKKRCRNQFKKLLEGACGKSLSLLYKDEGVIKDLPKLPKKPKPNTSILNENTEEVGLTELFSG